jgi:methoxymalonate biosynthesis protein
VKCLVWDLDNTLWKGTIIEAPDTQLHSDALNVLATLDDRGILQAVASKNDHDLAWARLEELGIAHYFVLPRIGWGRKSDSVREIAEELRFAPSTIAFIDDEPVERAEVSFHLPEVRCYPAEHLSLLTKLPEFSPPTVTVDSRRRRQMYQAGFRRHAERTAFNGPAEEFLRSLQLTMRIVYAGEDDLDRVEELTLRTSQMNATGVHYSHATLRTLLDDPQHEVLTASMTDRFGPYGSIGVMLLQLHPACWHLKLVATSCRVISLGAGTALLNWLITQAAVAGVHLAADFRPTDRNRIMEIAYRFAGFTPEQCTCLDALPTTTGRSDVQRLHLTPTPRSALNAINLTAPDLTALS